MVSCRAAGRAVRRVSGMRERVKTAAPALNGSRRWQPPRVGEDLADVLLHPHAGSREPRPKTQQSQLLNTTHSRQARQRSWQASSGSGNCSSRGMGRGSTPSRVDLGYDTDQYVCGARPNYGLAGPGAGDINSHVINSSTDVRPRSEQGNVCPATTRSRKHSEPGTFRWSIRRHPAAELQGTIQHLRRVLQLCVER